MAEKIKILDVNICPKPKTYVRTIDKCDSAREIASKKRFPFKCRNEVRIYISTNKGDFTLYISPKGYCWNGADIPQPVWMIIGSKYDPQYLPASMIHDYMLENKVRLRERFGISKDDYRLLTSLTFRECLKNTNVGTVKANIMAFFVDEFQKKVMW